MKFEMDGKKVIRRELLLTLKVFYLIFIKSL